MSEKTEVARFTKFVRWWLKVFLRNTENRQLLYIISTEVGMWRKQVQNKLKTLAK